MPTPLGFPDLIRNSRRFCSPKLKQNTLKYWGIICLFKYGSWFLTVSLCDLPKQTCGQ